MTQRTFLITGATKGIGLALSELLIADCHHVRALLAKQAIFRVNWSASIWPTVSQRARCSMTWLRRYAFNGVVNNVALVKPQRVGEVS